MIPTTGWNVQLHYDNLSALVKEQPRLGPMPSYKTVLRCMRENGWLQVHQPALPTRGQQRAADRLQRREVRGFEVAHVHGLWHLDFHQAKISILDATGKWHRPMTGELMRTLAAHAANNLRVLNQMAAELLATAAQRNLPRIDESLFL